MEMTMQRLDGIRLGIVVHVAHHDEIRFECHCLVFEDERLVSRGVAPDAEVQNFEANTAPFEGFREQPFQHVRVGALPANSESEGERVADRGDSHETLVFLRSRLGVAHAVAVRPDDRSHRSLLRVRNELVAESGNG
jgi:hypothetical protein